MKPSDSVLTLLLLNHWNDESAEINHQGNDRSSLKLLLLWLLILGGCSSPGSEADARNYFNSEFQKWMAGQKTDVSTMDSRLSLHKPPISYNVRSVVRGEADYSAYQGDKLPEDWKSWPAYQFNVVVEWKSEANTPLQKVTTYILTWNPHEKRWYARERF